MQAAPSGSREAASSDVGRTVSLLDSVHSQAADFMAQTRVVESHKASCLQAAKGLAASAEALRGRLRVLVEQRGDSEAARVAS